SLWTPSLVNSCGQEELTSSRSSGRERSHDRSRSIDVIDRINHFEKIFVGNFRSGMKRSLRAQSARTTIIGLRFTSSYAQAVSIENYGEPWASALLSHLT